MIRSRGASMLPKLMSHWWESLERPHRMFDQHFALPMNPEAMMNSFINDFDRRFRLSNRAMEELMNNEKRRGWSVIKDDKNKFHVSLDVQQFMPDEIEVKVVDNYVVVEGKHEEQLDEHGSIARHFIRKYLIPEQCLPEKATCTLSPDGVLTVTAPRKPEEMKEKTERVIKIDHIQKPAIDSNEKIENNQEPPKEKMVQKQ